MPGHEGPYIQFNPDNRVFWTSHTALVLDDVEADAAYQRAYRFLTDRVKKLINEHKWKEIDVGNRPIWLSLSENGYVHRFSLPSSFYSFLNSSSFGDWRMQFEMGVFEAKRPSLSDNDLFISGPAALSDIFYLLQSIAPGMLLICSRIDQADDMGELECCRALPREKWIADNSQMLKYVLGSSDAYQALLGASKDQGKAFTVSWINQWSDGDDSDCRSTGSRLIDDWEGSDFEWPKPPTKEYVSCGSECGGCNRCDLGRTSIYGS
ncbi:hypothetical protein K439DRAFT_1636596 [Ramaria rubella]|nr:hypothetical protein K439DRAFT_1636596 [Ramaria rubella]